MFGSMAQTTLHQRQASAEARLKSYNGVETVAAFIDPVSELRALTSACGVFNLGWRARIMVAGRDRVRWLNGMVTNTVKDLPLNRGNYSFVLNSQGRILADMYVYNRGDYLLLDTDRSQLETVKNTLKRFIIMDQVELKDAEQSGTIGLCGPGSAQVLAAAGIDASGMQPLEARDSALDNVAITLVRGPEQKPGYFEIWHIGADGEILWEKLVGAGAQPVGTEALELWRIVHGIPQYGKDIRERDLPQETEQAQALNFTKGCYIGQEIVERIRSRGQVHRMFTGFEFEPALPQPSKFEENGRVVAEITSVAQIGDQKIGLGYVRRESGAPGSTLKMGGTTATIVKPPFQIEWN